MTGDQSLELRGVVGIALGACGILSWKIAPRLRISESKFFAWLMAAYALSRLGLYTLVLLVLHMAPRGDINLYMAEAAPALAGKLVYRDFSTIHAPLDPYMLSSLLRLHNSPLTIILFSLILDILTIWVWLRIAPYFLRPLPLRRAALLVLFNPTSLLTEAIDGQLNSVVALLLALGIYTLIVRRNFLSGVCVALSASIVRFLSFIFAPGYLFASRRKGIATLGFLLVVLGVYGGFALSGADITVPLHIEGPHKTAGNLTFLIELLTGRSLGFRLPDAVLGLSWLFVVGLTFFAMRRVSANTQEDRRRTCFLLTISLIAELLCIQVFAKNGWERYLVMTMFPLCVIVAEMSFLQVVAFGIYAADIVCEPSYWANNMLWTPAIDLHARLFAGDRSVLALFAIESIEVGVGLLLFVSCVRRMLRVSARNETTDTPPHVWPAIPLD